MTLQLDVKSRQFQPKNESAGWQNKFLKKWQRLTRYMDMDCIYKLMDLSNIPDYLPQEML